MKNPKVSICIPAFKQPELLCKAIDSVLMQKFKDYEIIITDDSPDNSVESVIYKYRDFPNIHFFRNVQTLGSPENWNEAIRKASGNYIKILHTDDYFTFDYSLEFYVKLLDENKQADFAFSASKVIFDSGLNYRNIASKVELSRIISNPNILLYENKIGAPSAVIYRKSKHIFFDTNLKWLVDIEFYIRKIRNSHFAFSEFDLITTYGAIGRVTDICSNNLEVEIFEYFYVYEKIRSCKMFFYSYNNYKVIIKMFFILRKYSVSSATILRDCGFTGKLYWEMRLLIFFNKMLIFK